MLSSANPSIRFLGCDVGKAEIVVFDATSKRSRSIVNETKSLTEFAAGLDAGCFVVCEATGGYEGELLAALLAAGIRVHRADARKVKAFIRSFGTLGKTDRLDAKALARYGQERHAQLTPWQARDVERLRLQNLVLLRRDLVKDRQAYDNRRQAPGAGPMHVHLDPLVQAFEERIEAVQTDIEALVAKCKPIARDCATLIEIEGVGMTSAVAMLALLPELGTTSGKQITSLAGLAPHPRQSGADDGYRRVRGGRPEVKRVLFMAALSASKHHPKLKLFYQRLVKAGKKPLAAIVAVMRKLIVIANAKLKANARAQVENTAAENAPALA